MTRTVKWARYLWLCAEEPFRLLFPLGVTFGIIGVSLWPLFFLGAIEFYPATTHSRLMIEGMMSCFIFGFLGTAGPRVMAVRHFSRGEVVRLLLLITVAMVSHLTGWHPFGETLFLFALLLFACSLARRFLNRKDSPPPNFALVGLGLLNGLAGAGILVFCAWTGSAPTFYRFGSSLLNVGFVLLPLLGVAPFFIQRLLDIQGNDEPPDRTRRNFVLALITGLTIDASFAFELLSVNPIIGWTRCAAALVYLAVTLPLRGNSILATSLRMSLVALPAGLGLMAILPAYRIASMHVLFIAGFTLAIFSVATRVVLGHSGNLHLARRRIGWLSIALLFLILAMISRFVADLVATRNEHLLWGAVAWLLAAIIWGAIVLPHVVHAEAESP